MDKNISDQHLEIFNRGSLKIDDCIDVHNFNEENVLIETSLGLLNIEGEDLKVEKLDLDNKELAIVGNIYALSYEDDAGFMEKSSFLAKLFK